MQSVFQVAVSQLITLEQGCWAKFSLLLIIVNQILLKHSHAYLFTQPHDYISTTIIVVTCTVWPTKWKIFIIWLFKKNTKKSCPLLLQKKDLTQYPSLKRPLLPELLISLAGLKTFLSSAFHLLTFSTICLVIDLRIVYFPPQQIVNLMQVRILSAFFTMYFQSLVQGSAHGRYSINVLC